MDYRASFNGAPSHPYGRRGNGPACNQNARYPTNGPGPRNNQNWNWDTQSQNQNYNHGRHQNHNQDQRGHRIYNPRIISYNGTPSGPQNGNGRRNSPNLQRGPRPQHNQNRIQHQSQSQNQNSHFQDSPHQPLWGQHPYNQGRRSNGRRNRRNRNVENALDELINDQNGHQAQYEQSSPFSSLNVIDSNRISCIPDISPLSAQPAFLPFGTTEIIPVDEDIEMPDAPPLDQDIYHFQPKIEEFVREALGSLMYQVANEISELKQQSQQLNEAVIAMLLPQG